MKILVTGGAGFIGSNFIRYIFKTNKRHQVVNFDKLTYAGNLANLGEIASNPNYTFVRGDVRDTAAVESAMRGCDAVVHFAAESHVDRSIYEPSPVIQTNITGTFVLLEIARKISVGRFVHVSTDEVYGDIATDAFANEEFCAAAEQSLFRVQGWSGPASPILCADLRLTRDDHAFV